MLDNVKYVVQHNQLSEQDESILLLSHLDTLVHCFPSIFLLNEKRDSVLVVQEVVSASFLFCQNISLSFSKTLLIIIT